MNEVGVGYLGAGDLVKVSLYHHCTYNIAALPFWLQYCRLKYKFQKYPMSQHPILALPKWWTSTLTLAQQPLSFEIGKYPSEAALPLRS